MTDATTRQLMDDLRAVLADAEALMAASAADGGAPASGIRERVAESVGQARARLDELELDIAGQARAAADEAGRYVRDHPWQSVGIAAAAGVVIGLLLARR